MLVVAALSLLVALAATAPMPRAQTAPEPPQGDELLEDAAENDRETDDEGQPIEDYEASEQISEDLSVSFPVDI